jgi:hypothetical protein
MRWCTFLWRSESRIYPSVQGSLVLFSSETFSHSLFVILSICMGEFGSRQRPAYQEELSKAVDVYSTRSHTQ